MIIITTYPIAILTPIDKHFICFYACFCLASFLRIFIARDGAIKILSYEMTPKTCISNITVIFRPFQRPASQRSHFLYDNPVISGVSGRGVLMYVDEKIE